MLHDRQFRVYLFKDMGQIYCTTKYLDISIDQYVGVTYYIYINLGPTLEGIKLTVLLHHMIRHVSTTIRD